MKKITHLAEDFAVTAALSPSDFPQAAALGFKSIVSNLPDGETPAFPDSAKAAALAREAGLEYRHIPTTKLELFSNRVVDGMADALATLPRPILAHCLSGQRSVVAWAAAMARHEPVDTVLERVKAAGFNLEPLRDELAAVHDQHRGTS
jgi:uncharacterized protein (TIGR01244 family)